MSHRRSRSGGGLVVLALSVSLALGAARTARAQSDPKTQPSVAPEVALRGGLGFSASPETFVLSLDAPVRVEGDAWLGPKVRLGVSDRYTYVAGSAGFEYVFDLGREFEDDVLRRLAPVLGAGLGFTFLDDDRRNRDDVGMLIHLDAGFEFRVNDSVSLGSHMRFDILPVDAINQRFIYNWQVLTTRVRF